MTYGKLLYDRKLTVGTAGNLSARSGDAIVITPTGVCKGLMHEYDLIRMEISTGRVTAGGRPSMETPFHLAFYRNRADVGAVIHCHPLYCTVLASAKKKLRADITPEGIMVLDEVQTVPYATPGSEELAHNLIEAMQKGNGFLLENHGAIAVGKDVAEAYYRMETMEFLAEMQVKGASTGLAPLPEEEANRIRSAFCEEK
ncbi:MAG TPA: class II aldolase/adducin family protein [Methanomassiliicoccales archaeon]|nr:class II aldolase/adducin family protein [Methanomassiliicoccales archaeon]